MVASVAMSKRVLGVDLSGPTNTAGTAVAVFVEQGERLRLEALRIGAGDRDLCALVEGLDGRGALSIGLDAPLSYNEGGGDRLRDRMLRSRLVEAGLPAGSVMTPTMTRMAYLTLRGVTVARLLAGISPGAAVCEVHPGGAMALRGAPLGSLRAMKKEPRARDELLRWLRRRALDALPERIGTDHEIAAVAAGLATWHWRAGAAVFRIPAEPPHHPYDMIC